MSSTGYMSSMRSRAVERTWLRNGHAVTKTLLPSSGVDGAGTESGNLGTTALEDLVRVLEDVADRYPGVERDLYEAVMSAAASLATLSERGRRYPSSTTSERGRSSSGTTA
jgi:hypothetical protein